MIDIESFETILNELSEELPVAFYDELNLGIVISENEKIHPKSAASPLYILGEYRHDMVGRGIVIYFGSFMQCYGGASEQVLRQKMRETLRHEFRHHMESRAGLRDLEIIDKMEIEAMTGQKSDY